MGPSLLLNDLHRCCSTYFMLVLRQFVPNLFPICSQSLRLHPFSETVFDGHTCSSLSFLPVSRGSRGSGGLHVAAALSAIRVAARMEGSLLSISTDKASSARTSNSLAMLAALFNFSGDFPPA